MARYVNVNSSPQQHSINVGIFVEKVYSVQGSGEHHQSVLGLIIFIRHPPQTPPYVLRIRDFIVICSFKNLATLFTDIEK